MSLSPEVVEVVREETRAVLTGPPTVYGVLQDIGFLLGVLPPESARDFAILAIKPLADLIDATTPADEPELETTGAEATGETEE